MIRLAVALWLFLATAAAAEFPALFNVTGVASDDVLNVRDAPSANGTLLGSLAPDEQFIEVIRTNATGTWGLINIEDKSGWVSLRYLARVSQGSEPKFPALTQCSGTEPFWGFRILQTNYAEWFSVHEVTPMQIDPPQRASGRSEPFAYTGKFVANPPQIGVSRFSYIVQRAACNDGMSDRAYGYKIDFLMHHKNSNAVQPLLTGCCTIMP